MLAIDAVRYAHHSLRTSPTEIGMRHASTFQSALILIFLLLPVAGRAGDAFQRITPAEAGYSEAGLQALAQVLDESGSESMLLLHDGKMFFEWGDIRQKRLVHSIRKPLLHALIGVELAKGNDCLDLDRIVADYGLDEDPPGLTAREKTATFRQLLQSRSGIYHPAAAESEGMQAQRPARGSHAPGEFFYYNNWDFNAAGEIYKRCTGRGIHDAFLVEIARPLGMLDYRGRISAWPDENEPLPEDADGFIRLETDKSRMGADHFRLSAHDLRPTLERAGAVARRGTRVLLPHRCRRPHAGRVSEAPTGDGAPRGHRTRLRIRRR
jgi:CubicO group peptidase (beta-lactamase class C family)